LETIPREEHETLCQFIQENAMPFDPRPDRALEYAENMSLKPPEARAEIFRLWKSTDPRDRTLASTRALHRPPMPDVRSAFIRDALTYLKRALKSPFDAEPEAGEFAEIIERLQALDGRLDNRYQELKRQEAQYVEEDLRRREAISA